MGHARPSEISPQFGLVCFAVGAAQVPPGQAVAGPVLLRLLADLGVSGSAARSLLLRMRREGWLTSEHVGRNAHYRLAPLVFAGQERVERQLRGDRPAWHGSLSGVLYSVPERFRFYRDRLRRTALLLGYVSLRPGLLVATTDRYDELVAVLPPRPAGSQLLRSMLTFSAEDTSRIVADLWDLDVVAACYRQAIAEFEERVAQARREPPAGAAALRAFAVAALSLYQAASADPDLPAELLPADWPGRELSAAISRAFAEFVPLVADYLDGFAPRELVAEVS
ncbi:MAG TPA: PaaX family transcriptional regulator C-terminal domain-containing protein [Streptosporangiaceae bacterium]|jgi:phenylacetic acid degradation operon negative regulatory protein